jgi:hypothetical protein
VDHNDTLVAPPRAAEDRGDPERPRDGPLVLGRYRLRERLGAGGFGVVWRAHDELLRREVAVKQIPLPTGEDRERATREALASARLAHPAIVALYEACAGSDAFYLISELVEGETLARLIADDALADQEILELGIALCDALAHAHARGVIHRDVKPQNVLLPDPPRAGAPAPLAAAKLTDFGGARLAGEDALTRTGDVLGTLAYMAPEQCDGHTAGCEADLYSLALVLYEALSGVNPVRGPTPAATVRRIGRPLPPLRRYRRDLPHSLGRALDRALSPRPRERGTLAELRQALEHEAARMPEQSRTDTGGWLTLPRAAWSGGTLAVCAWQIGAARPGVALVALCAVLPLVLLVRRPGPRWLAAGLAPVLGLLGLAGAFPALAGQLARWRSRALLGALGYWWLALAEPLLDGPGGRLWLGLPAGSAGSAARLAAWEGSPTAAAAHALAPLLAPGLLLGGALWAAAAVVLPWAVRGRGALPDALAATLWATALAAASPLLATGFAPSPIGHATQAAPRGVILGSALGAVLAVAARALRGRAGEPV